MDREKVIVGIEHCDRLGCSMCPYKPGGYTPMNCRIQLMRDALALLKEQQEEITLMKTVYGDQGEIVGELVRCKDCKYHDEEDGRNFCDCGDRPDDWFCAGGKRKDT